MAPKRVLVIGAGLMGSQIAVDYAAAGHSVTVVSRDLEAAAARIETAGELFGRCRNGSPEALAAVAALPAAVAAWEQIELAEVDLAVESVGEVLELKAELLGRVAAASPTAVLATNTSSIRISEIGAAIGAPERVIGTHYWNPPLLMPAVEVIRGEGTAPEVEAEMLELLGEMGKIPILARRDVPGFVWNRLQAALLREAVWLVDNGVATAATVDAAVRFGLAPRAVHTGLFQTVELGGVEVWNALMENVAPELSDAAEVGDLSTRLEGCDRAELEAAAKRRDEGLAARLAELEAEPER